MQQTEPVNILLVDDRPENLLSLQAILEDLGQNMISASSGLEALRHLLDREFALILLDVQMPGMDGFETARLIRAREQSRRTPIVFLTAIDQQEAHVFEGYAAGAVDFLFKPFPPEILRAKVSTFVELARQAAERAAEVALRREAEREIRELNDTLERRVRERTAELAREVRERKRAEAALRERVRLGALRVDVSAALARSGDLQCVLQECAAALIRHPGAAFARIWTYSETDDVLELQSSAGEFAATADAFARIRLGDYLIGHVAEQRTPYVTSDLVHDPLFGGREWAAEHRITAFAGYPLLVEHRPVGVMAAFSRRAFTEEVLDAFATIAEGIAQYIQRKRAEEALRGRAEELATLARRKDDFLSMLAHELRNPLGAVSNALHVMNLSGPQAQPFHRARAVAFRQIQHQRRIVDDLLDVARTNRGRLDLRHEPLDLVALVHDTVEDYRAVVDEAQLSVELDLPEVPVTVVGDRVRLAQIVGNLLDNAARFTPAGGEVQISLAVGPEESFAAVTVRDTGVGIEPELLPHLFESL
ncbi:MAG TPA: response regulator, partial [Armatimonadota bacterium]|nr:response regulator [Armatimonadota bacterium]